MENLDDFAPTDDKGMTPLHYAAQGGYLEVCKTLLEKVLPWMIALCIILCKHTFLDLSKYLGMIKRQGSREEFVPKIISGNELCGPFKHVLPRKGFYVTLALKWSISKLPVSW